MAHHATPDIADRLWARVPSLPHDSCWEWAGSRDAQGYGIFLISKRGGVKRRGMAHRLAYELARSTTIPDDMQIDHLCRNTSCVNPDHLEVVTARTNSRRSLSESGRNFRKTHCVHGHPFDAANTRITPQGKRVCLACRKRRAQAVAA
jgi:hypothetical protein